MIYHCLVVAKCENRNSVGKICNGGSSHKPLGEDGKPYYIWLEADIEAAKKEMAMWNRSAGSRTTKYEIWSFDI